MIGIEQLFIVFVLVFIIAYLVGMGIDYSAKSKFPTMVIVSDATPLVAAPSAAVLPSDQSPLISSAKNVADAIAATSSSAVNGRGEELKEDLVKMDELRSGDLIANEAAIEEFGNRLRKKLEGVNDRVEKESLSQKIDYIEDELMH